MTETEWFTIEQAANRLQMSTRTVRRRITDGSLPAQRLGPRLIRVNAQSLRDFERQGTLLTHREQSDA